MSFEFTLVTPTVPALDDLRAALPDPDTRFTQVRTDDDGAPRSALMSIPGASTRGVALLRSSDSLTLRINSFASRADAELCRDAARVLSRMTGAEITGEDGVTAQADTVDDVFGEAWVVSRLDEATIVPAMLRSGRGPITLQGTDTKYHIDLALLMSMEAEDDNAAVALLLEHFAQLQARAARGDLFVPAEFRTTAAYGSDIAFITLSPDTRTLIPNVDYAILRKDDDRAHWMPVDALRAEAGNRVWPMIDALQIEIPPLDAEAYDALIVLAGRQPDPEPPRRETGTAPPQAEEPGKPAARRGWIARLLGR